MHCAFNSAALLGLCSLHLRTPFGSSGLNLSCRQSLCVFTVSHRRAPPSYSHGHGPHCPPLAKDRQVDAWRIICAFTPVASAGAQLGGVRRRMDSMWRSTSCAMAVLLPHPGMAAAAGSYGRVADACRRLWLALAQISITAGHFLRRL